MPNRALSYRDGNKLPPFHRPIVAMYARALFHKPIDASISAASRDCRMSSEQGKKGIPHLLLDPRVDLHWR
jgi:hypothetical protein